MSQLGVQTKKISARSLAALFCTPIFTVVALLVIVMVRPVTITHLKFLVAPNRHSLATCLFYYYNNYYYYYFYLR